MTMSTEADSEIVDRMCAAAGVQRTDVDVDAVLDLTRHIAHNSDRPMAPIGAFIAGLAVGGRGADLSTVIAELSAVVEDRLHP